MENEYVLLLIIKLEIADEYKGMPSLSTKKLGFLFLVCALSFIGLISES